MDSLRAITLCICCLSSTIALKPRVEYLALQQDTLSDLVVKSDSPAPSPPPTYQHNQDINIWSFSDAEDGSINRLVAQLDDPDPVQGGDPDQSHGGEGELARIIVDPASFDYEVSTLPGYGGNRTISSVHDTKAAVTHRFVSNEVLLSTDDPTILNEFVSRWDGDVLGTFNPRDIGTDNPVEYLVRVDPSNLDTSSLPAYWQRLGYTLGGEFKLSEHQGHQLLTLVAQERLLGTDVSVNWIFEPFDLRGGVSTEARNGPPLQQIVPAGPFRFAFNIPYSPNAFNWPYMSSGSTQDIGVGRAWAELKRKGLLTPWIKVAIIDAGFSTTSDLPRHRYLTLLNINPRTTREVSGCPSPCRHGAQVASVMMGLPDNNVGSAGPAGPVVDVASFIYHSLDAFSFRLALNEAVSSESRVINMSFGALAPRFAINYGDRIADIEGMLRGIRRGGKLLFAAAGNDGEDLDDRVLFSGGPLSPKNFPCEVDGVICVGGLATGTLNRAPNSNFGQQVDIFGPFTTYIGPTAPPSSTSNGASSEDTVSIANGTSMSSSFVAGVAALIWSTDPSMTADEVEDILLSTAKPSPDDNVTRVVDAYQGVLLGLQRAGIAPSSLSLEILAPTPGTVTEVGARSLPLGARAFDPRTNRPDVIWRSNLEGEIGRGEWSSHIFRRSGRHVITATLTSGVDGETIERSVTIDAIAEAPRINIVSPRANSTVVVGENEAIPRINVVASTYDPTTMRPVPDSQISWFLGEDDEEVVANGASAYISVDPSQAGSLLIRSRALANGQTAEDSVRINLVSLRDDNSVPTGRFLSPQPRASIYGNELNPADNYSVDVRFVVEAVDVEDGSLTRFRDGIRACPISEWGAAIPDETRCEGLLRSDRVEYDPASQTFTYTISLESDGITPQRYHVSGLLVDSGGQSRKIETQVLVNVLN